MIPKDYIGHQLENRTRFYLPLEKGNPSVFTQIEDKLSDCDGVDRVQINPRTGSILVLHQKDLPSLIQFSQANALFEIDQTLEDHQNWADELLGKLSAIDKRVNEATQGDLNLASLAALGLLSAGAFQISRGQYLPAASTLITDAMRILLQANRSNTQTSPYSTE